jgi:hypothetical protein
MIAPFIALSLMLSGTLHPAFLSGDAGLYSQRAAFRKPGEVYLNITESMGTRKDIENGDSWFHHQLCANLQYAPFSRLILGMFGTSSAFREETYHGLCANVKFPLLTIGRFTSSIGPSLRFSTPQKPSFGGAIFIDLIPFSSEQLPPILISPSLCLLRTDGLNEFRSSAVLTFHKGTFLPFLEFYTEFHNRINWESSYNARLATGVAFSRKPFDLHAAVEIPLNEYEKRDFDFRFSVDFGITCIARRTSKASISLSVADASNDEFLDATITITGKEVQKVLQCTTGKCVISDLVAGLYTLQIEHPGYKNIKAPLFVKDKMLEKVFKLIKLEKEKGGDLPENE